MLFSSVYSDSWPHQEGLKICHININHIINKIDEISHISFSNNLDIFGVSESRLNVNNNDDEIQIPGYFVERKDSSFSLFITRDYVSILNVTFNIHVERI